MSPTNRTARASGRRRPPTGPLRSTPRADQPPPGPSEPPRVVVLHAVESRPWPARDLVRAGALVAAALFVGAALAFGASGLLPPRYEARAEVTYRLQAELGAGFLRQDRRLSTQIVAMTGRATLARVATEVDVPIEDLQRIVGASVVGDSEVLRIRAVDTDRARALRIVERVRTVYLAQANEVGDTDERTRLDAELADLGRAQAELVAQGALSSIGDEIARLRSELTAVRVRIDAVTDRVRALARETQQRQPATALADPYLLADPVSPRRAMMAVGGALAAGLAASVGVVVGRQVTLRKRGRP